MAGRIPAVPGGRGSRLSEALGPPLSRVAGYKFQVDDLFHGRSDTGVPRGEGLRLSEALGPPLSRVAGYKCSGWRFFSWPVGYRRSQGGRAYASAKPWDRHSPEWLVQMFRLTIPFMAGRIPAVPGEGLTPQRSPVAPLLVYLMRLLDYNFCR